MKKLLILIVIWGFLSACESSPSREPASSGQPAVSTTPPAHLYFKNIRSINYEQQTQPDTRIDLYKLRRFSDTKERPILYPVIADNWMQDEAYLLIQPNDFEDGFSDPLRVFWSSPQDSGRYELRLASRADQFRFAENLYRSLRQDHQLAVETATGNRMPLFRRREDRRHFITTIQDYQKLTARK